MAISKRGYYFSLTVIILLGLVTAYWAAKATPGYTRAAQLDTQRLAEDQAFMDSLSQDANSALAITGYRSFLAIDEAITKQGNYVHDIDETVQEAAIHGTINGEKRPLLEENTLTTWTLAMQQAARYLGLELTLTDLEVSATQEDPWHITLTLTSTLDLQDPIIEASWHHQLTAKASLPITGLNDPLYTIGTDQRYMHQITNASTITDFKTHIQEHRYIKTDKAPSYLDRLQGLLGPSPNGIESLVNVPTMHAVNINNEGSIVDWRYFGETATASCRIPGVDAWAVITGEEASRYGITC